MVSQETAADSSISFWYSEELCDQIQHINTHFARKRQSQANEILSQRSFCPLVGGSSHNSSSTYVDGPIETTYSHQWILTFNLSDCAEKKLSMFLSCRTSGSACWSRAQQTLRCLSTLRWWHWTVYWNVPSATTVTVSSESNANISNTSCISTFVFLKSCSVSRSSSKYASAIIELSDLIIERRQRILHHWDWIYWRTQQGKRFKKALSIVHKYMFLKNIFTKLISSCRTIIAWQLQVYQGCGAEAIGSD